MGKAEGRGVTFDLPMPPSLNGMFATDFKTKRRFASKAYTAWKREAGDALGAQYAAYGSPSVHKPVRLHIKLGINYQSDIANREKAITDLLVANIDMPDDRYIDFLMIERDQSVTGAVVTIEGCAIAPQNNFAAALVNPRIGKA
jgi:hypothetical protein